MVSIWRLMRISLKMEKRRARNLRIESMKKATKARRPSNAKAPAQKGKGLVNPILDMLKNMDEDLVAMLRQAVQKEMGFGSEMFRFRGPCRSIH